ncbi:MAG: hypothetical protein IAE82_06170 [Opitutaceae bacterium]|nr:hypothetical protein [Opitutaceae bacterium]
MADAPQKPADPRLAHALELIAEAEKLTIPGDAASLGRAAAHAEASIELLRAFVGSTPTPEARNLLAAAWMRRGVVLLVLNLEPRLPESIRCFDEAIRLRRELLAAHKHPALVHAQASSFLGRGDALARQGGETNLRQALASYDEAIALLDTLPVRQSPQLMAQVIAAHGSRAAVFEALRSPDAIAQAVQVHRGIAELIRGTPAEKHPDFRLHLGAAHANAANLLLVGDAPTFDPAAARAESDQARIAVEGLERDNPVAGEIAIKARRGVCRAIAALVEARGNGSAPREFLNAMTDAADEALALARQWEAKGVLRFRPLAIELFAFGANLYVRHQTHFFAEFVLDNLDPEQSADAFRNCPEMHGLATTLVADALRHYERDRMITTATKDVDRQIEIMQGLRHAAERLAAVKPASG